MARKGTAKRASARKASTLAVQDLSRVVELAVHRAAGVPEIRPGIILGRWVAGEIPDAANLAAKITRQVGPQFKGMKLTPVSFPGGGGTTLGFIAVPKLDQL